MKNIALLLVGAALLAACQTTAPVVDPAQIATVSLSSATYAGEAADWGVAPQKTIYKGAYHTKTPTSLPGARTITTAELQKLIASGGDVVLIDVLGGGSHPTLPFSHWLNGAGVGDGFDDKVQARLSERLATLTGGNRAKPVVFFCLNSECWLSYNAALRAVELGHTTVLWYRGGQESWKAAGLPMVTSVNSW